MFISGSSGIANNDVNNAIPSNPPADNSAAVTKAINMPWQVLSAATLPEQKGINERQICAAVNPEDGGHNPVKTPEMSPLNIYGTSDNIEPDSTSDVPHRTSFGSPHPHNERGLLTTGFIFGNSNDVDPLGLPKGDINPGFTYHSKTYLDDTDVYLIYYFNDTGSDSVQLTKQAIAELEKADPDIFQGLSCPNLLFSRNHNHQIRMSEQERILRWQPLAQLILLEEGSTNPNDRSVDLSRIFEIKGSGQDTSRQHNTEKPDLFSGSDSLSYIAEICRLEQEMAISSWKVAKVPFGLFRRGFYRINRLRSPYERELARPDYEGFAKARDDWAKSRFVSQLHKLIHSSDKTSENIVQTLKQIYPPASSEADENSVSFIDIASELDSQLGLGMTRFEAELISPPPRLIILS